MYRVGATAFSFVLRLQSNVRKFCLAKNTAKAGKADTNRFPRSYTSVITSTAVCIAVSKWWHELDCSSGQADFQHISHFLIDMGSKATPFLPRKQRRLNEQKDAQPSRRIGVEGRFV